ncbi:alcohol dehydrogenase catalytic domain-containing protein [Xenorhabdus sp. PR6a]|uniref:alcohol dehydrogenase catalytic domain-containing protein n=1 Tax=Xenorhabdus sp. PR6a TaxID=3025877 RepID=UPI00235A1935|nr:alcohol dehydrogenase catalytic domain-containing protein [Xenorhabdus sp. PR6a]MDC9581440.1 alcohol dehydrogenase catalytic domain-containing protein [Xenorhabdus sp. PR6a]
MRNFITNEEYLDVFTLGEPLACVMHAYRRLPETLAVGTITIFGAGPIGALHALYARTLYPFSLVQIVEPDERRQALISSKLPFISVHATPDGIRQSNLTIVATSAPEAQTDAIKTAADAAIVILFSGINYKTKDELPHYEEEDLEAIHRREEVRVVSRNIRLIGSSGYHPREIDSSIAHLRANPDYYSIVQTGIVDGLDGRLINNLTTIEPAIVKLLSDGDFGQNYLKVLFRHDHNPVIESRVVFEGGEVKLQNFTPEQPGPNQVRVRVLRSSICQTDRRVLRGLKSNSLRDGLIFGHEGVGVVLSVGQGVSEQLVGSVCSILPHYFAGEDPQVNMGMGYLSASMQHLGIHVNGCFTTSAIFPVSCIRQHIDPDFLSGMDMVGLNNGRSAHHVR